MLATALVTGVMAMLASQAGAQVQACTAALDVDVHYCLDDPLNHPTITTCPASTQPLPPVPPNGLEVGDTVILTMEVTNDSQITTPPDPPQGILQGAGAGQAVFKIFYACTASTCSPGEERMWFQFNSATVREVAVGKATFTDDGNGFSGTLTIDNDILYAANDGDGKILVEINLTVVTNPGINVPVFARAEGNPAALLVTDNRCLQGLTGTGEGSTAAVFGGTIDRQCGNNARITFPTATKPGTVNVALRTPGQLNQLMPNQPATLTISNAGGACFSRTVAANAPGWKSLCTYSDPSVQDGIFKITCQQRASNGGEIQIRVQARGDTSACNLATMTTDVMLGGQTFTQTGTWRPTPNGLRFP